VIPEFVQQPFGVDLMGQAAGMIIGERPDHAPTGAVVLDEGLVTVIDGDTEPAGQLRCRVIGHVEENPLLRQVFDVGVSSDDQRRPGVKPVAVKLMSTIRVAASTCPLGVVKPKLATTAGIGKGERPM
jgi:hypothetical protein